jgi:hypothetical protein
MTSTNAPCRLFVYLAREAPLGVVLRRGPSEWARLSLWHTDTDVLEHGQWIKARVYERRCDVSADGSLFAAFLRQGGGPPSLQRRADSWLAVSRPPYFTALALWFVGGTYHTGGFFPDRGCFWAGFSEAPPDIGQLPAWLAVRAPRDIPYVDGTTEWTDRTVHFNRLLRDGWQKLDDSVSRSVWQHDHRERRLSLIMAHSFDSFGAFGGPYRLDYSVIDRQTGDEHSIGEASWADWDQQGRLVVAREGSLWQWSEAAGLVPIADLNDQTPDPQPSPATARVWPPPPRPI